MTTLLRRSAQAVRLSPGLRTCTRSRNLALRPQLLPRHAYSAYRVREYGTQPEDKPDAKRKAARNNVADKHTARDAPSKVGKAAPGTEHLYDHSSPMVKDASGSSSSNTSRSQLLPGNVHLGEEQLRKLRFVYESSKNGMPAPVLETLETTLKSIQEKGVTPEQRQTIIDIIDGHMTPGKAAKLIKLGFSLAKRLSEEELQERRDARGTSGSAAEQKTPAEPGPSDAAGDKGGAGGGGGKKRDNKSGQNKPREVTLDLTSIIGSVVGLYIFSRLFGNVEASREISWQEFRNTFMDKGLVEKLVVVNKETVEVHLHREAVAAMYPESPAANPGFTYTFTIGSVEAFERKIDEAQTELGIPTSQRLPVQYTRRVPLTDALFSFAPAILAVGALIFISRRVGGGGGGGAGGGIFGMGRSRAKKFNHETDVKVTFADVAGMDEAKQEIMEFVSFLREPGMYQKLGAKIPRGAILSGPPGTGKTLLAKATAGESGVPFFSVSGSEFVEMFVGVGASRVRDLFQNARKSTPCIIFIDEIDAIGKSRSKNNFSGGNDEREATLNQILTEMDGFNTSEQVVVLAGTNRADTLDSALIRPGRFDRHIAIDKPTMEGRKQIFKVHLKKIVTKVDTEYLEGRLAALTPGFSGADIANCVNEAALIAARGNADTVLMNHFESAIERVIGGLEKRSLVLSPEEKRTVAYHEAGHAICGWFFRWADPLLKVSIIPRGSGALGYAQYLPAGDTYLLNVNQLMDRLAMTLGGRVSEELHFDTVTSGASDDFNKVTRMATAMVTKWGMSPKIGYRYYEDDAQQQLHKPFSEETARDIDAEVRRIVDEAYKQCKDLLSSRRKEVGIVAEELLEKEMLTRDDMIRLLGPRPFPDKPEFSKYFDGSKGDREGHGSAIPPDESGKGASGPTILPGGDGGGSANPAPTIFKGMDHRREKEARL